MSAHAIPRSLVHRMTDAPIAFVTFNRPDCASASMQRIREARPAQLFLVSDGPREHVAGEADLVRQTRQQCEDAVDWDCDVQRIYSDHNLGCGQRISSAITQAFESVEKLIVLEDDCVAHEDFFPYCDKLLDRYRDDERIMAISGDNFQHGQSRTLASYYFSVYAHCWGWATWRRAWNNFDLKLSHWPAFRDGGFLGSICQNQWECDYWTDAFDRSYAGHVDTWDFAWMLACWMNHGLTAIPRVNLISNIGHDERATHTQKVTDESGLQTHALGDIVHPRNVVRHSQADRYTDDTQFSGPSRRQLFKRLRRSLGITSKKRRAA